MRRACRGWGCLAVFLLLPTFCFPVAAAADRVLEFPEVLAAARAHAPELRIAAAEARISGSSVAEAAAGYYPVLSLRMNNEYLHDFAGSGDTTTVGDTVLSGSGSAWQNSVSMVAEYTLWDGGRRGRRYERARHVAQRAGFAAGAAARRLSLDVLDLFHRGVRAGLEVGAGREILTIRRRIYEAEKRLRLAGKVSVMDVAAAGIAVAESLSEIDRGRRTLADVLAGLSRYTGEGYPGDTGFATFAAAAGGAAAAAPESLPEIRALDAGIAAKEAELEEAEGEWWPRLGLYYSYRLYGSDSSSFRESFDDLRRRNYAVGISWQWNLFNGFADAARVERLRAELEKLRLERDRALAELAAERKAMARKAALMAVAAGKTAERSRMLARRREAVARLAAGRIRDRIFFLKQLEKDVRDRLALELEETERLAMRLRLRLWNGEQR